MLNIIARYRQVCHLSALFQERPLKNHDSVVFAFFQWCSMGSSQQNFRGRWSKKNFHKSCWNWYQNASLNFVFLVRYRQLLSDLPFCFYSWETTSSMGFPIGSLWLTSHMRRCRSHILLAMWCSLGYSLQTSELYAGEAFILVNNCQCQLCTFMILWWHFIIMLSLSYVILDSPKILP